jgi:hypothetical protein
MHDTFHAVLGGDTGEAQFINRSFVYLGGVMVGCGLHTVLRVFTSYSNCKVWKMSRSEDALVLNYEDFKSW